MLELLAALEASAFATWVREASTIWAYPTILTLHTLGLAVLVGANAAFDLRVLGVGRQIPLAPIEWLFPAMWVGFGLNAITGAMLFSADPIEKGTTALFVVKMAIVMAGVVLIPLLRRGGIPPGPFRDCRDAAGPDLRGPLALRLDGGDGDRPLDGYW